MTRTLLAILVAITMCAILPGCDESDPEDDKMTQRRDSPPPRAAPGADMGLTAGDGDDEDADPPATQGDGG